MREPDRKTAIITGGAGGLGSALAEKLIAEGWHVCLLDLPGSQLQEAERSFSGRSVSIHPCDITREREVADVSEKILSDQRSIDLVIYNAGVSQIGELTGEPLSAHRYVFEVNYFGSLHLLREMIEPVRQSRGTHLAISSVAGFSPLYHRTAYSASKHALEGLFKSLRAEEAAHGVTVAIAAPSFIATNLGNPDLRKGGIVRPGSAPDGIDYMSPRQAAEEILTGLSRKRSYIPVGKIAKLAWRINRFLPESYFRMMMKRIKR